MFAKVSKIALCISMFTQVYGTQFNTEDCGYTIVDNSEDVITMYHNGKLFVSQYGEVYDVPTIDLSIPFDLMLEKDEDSSVTVIVVVEKRGEYKGFVARVN